VKPDFKNGRKIMEKVEYHNSVNPCGVPFHPDYNFDFKNVAAPVQHLMDNCLNKAMLKKTVYKYQLL
jgi:hypothetical protein